jgi:hypothetical protein
MRSRSWLPSVALLLLLALAGPARAVQITWSFTGEVALVGGTSGEVASLASGGVVVGAPVSGQMVFESTTSDSDPDPFFGRYLGAVTDLRAEFAALVVSFEASGLEQVALNVEGAGLPFVYAAQGRGADSTGTFANVVFSLELVDASNAAFPNDSLPLSRPPLSALDPYSAAQADDLGFTTRLYLGFSPTAAVDVELTSLVPEPGALTLLGAGIALSVLLRRSR